MFFGKQNDDQDAAGEAPTPTPSATPTPEQAPTPTPSATPTPTPSATTAPADATKPAVDHAAELKALEAEATELLHRIDGKLTSMDKLASYELSMAKIKLQQFVTWVEKHFEKSGAK